MKIVECKILLGFVELNDFISDALGQERGLTDSRSVLVGGMVFKVANLIQLTSIQCIDLLELCCMYTRQSPPINVSHMTGLPPFYRNMSILLGRSMLIIGFGRSTFKFYSSYCPEIVIAECHAHEWHMLLVFYH